jgi:hypothetical protein
VGRRACDIEYYEILGALQMAMSLMLSTAKSIEYGELDPHTTAATHNVATQILARSLGLPVPDLAPEYVAPLALISRGSS